MIDLPAIRQFIESAPVAELPQLLGELEALKASAWVRLTAPPPAPPATAGLVDAAEMAYRLGTPENWVRDKARGGKIPFVRLGHYMRFEPAAVIAAVRTLRLTLPESHNAALRTMKNRKQGQAVTSQVSTKCPTSTGSERETGGSHV